MPLPFGRKAKLAENREMKAGNSQDYRVNLFLMPSKGLAVFLFRCAFPKVLIGYSGQ